MKNLPVLPYYFLKGQIQLNKFISLENKHLFLASEVKKKKILHFENNKLKHIIVV